MTAAWPASSNCRRPAGSAATGCGRTARSTQAALDGLKDGVAIDGVLYGAVEATLDRVQGSNVWLMVGLREGKNREVKRVLAHLGLATNRLIRISFGPFQLGDLAERRGARDPRPRAPRPARRQARRGRRRRFRGAASAAAGRRTAAAPLTGTAAAATRAAPCASSAVSSAAGRSPTPRSRAIRPSADRLRQTLFDILAHGYGDAIAGARVLDLFAGTGALGLEALSRGAAFALFVEEGVEARGLHPPQRRGARPHRHAPRIFRRDATRLGPAGTVAPFGLVFADPPYGPGSASRRSPRRVAGGWLTPGALCVLEEDARAEVSAVPGLEALETRLVGDSKLIFLRGPGALDRS